jgi:hypothetical protein
MTSNIKIINSTQKEVKMGIKLCLKKTKLATPYLNI